LDALALASERFSPADIEFAARKASQQALEHAVQATVHPVPEDQALTTRAYLQAIEGTRATVTETVVKDFLEDIERIARV
jgi:transitional endoplasmic reticulum ATPase